MSLEVGRWLGVPCLPAVCLYRAAPAPELPPPSLQHVLPLWTALMSLGRAGLVSQLRQAFSLAAGVERRVAAVPKLQILVSRRPDIRPPLLAAVD